MKKKNSVGFDILSLLFLVCIFCLVFFSYIGKYNPLNFSLIFTFSLLSMILFFYKKITLNKKTEDDLREREDRYQALFENNKTTIILIDSETLKIVDANPAACEYYGWSREEMASRKITDINILPLEEAYAVKERANSEGKNHYHFKHQLANGEIRDVKVYNGPLCINGQKLLYSMVHDITRQKLTEQELKASEGLYRAIFKASPDVIVITDLEGNFLNISHAGANIFGYDSCEEGIGKSFKDFVAPEDHERASETVNKRLKGLYSGPGEYCGVRKDGSRFDIEVNADFIKDEFGNPINIVFIIRDVTERNKIKNALRESQERNEALFKANPDMMFMLDENGLFLDFYSGNNSPLYLSKKSFSGKRISDVMPAEITELAYFHLKLLFQCGEMQVFKFPLEIEKELKYFEGRLVKSGCKNALLVVSDISSRMKAEQELIKAKEKAEESDRLKSAFLANMSHEIRTPMNGILGFAGLLKESDITSEERNDYINVIEKSGERLLNIINDIVEISKIEAGMVEMRISDFNLNDHTEYIGKFFRPETEKKGMKLLVKNGLEYKDATVRADGEKLYAVLINLVKNAIKYSNEGTIEVGYERKDRLIEFYVRDNGIGIPQNMQNAIFNRFVQTDTGRKKALEGTGLGLAISKAYVEMMGGKIWVDSTLGEGSTFYFTISDINETDKVEKFKDKDIDTDIQHKNLKLLIAEDDDSSVKLLTKLMSPYCSKIVYASTGIEAVEACRINQDLHMVLMDVQMPGSDGYEAAKEIRKFNPEVAIIAQTAFALSDDKENAVNAGCNDYISKPINKDVLLKLILKHVPVFSAEVSNNLK